MKFGQSSYMHEYGHYLQSQRYGPRYLTEVGIPSIFSANKSEVIEGDDIYNPYKITTHKTAWFEMDANKRAANYFGEHNGVNWRDPNFFYAYPIRMPNFKNPDEFIYYMYLGNSYGGGRKRH